MTSTLDKAAPVVVVGAGTFGLSTAWHLARRGYTNITVIDRHEAPSIASAGSDLNKIFRTEYSDPIYARLASEARTVWLEEEVLRPSYHESGYVFCCSGRSELSVKNWEESVRSSRALGYEMEDLLTPPDFQAKAPFLNGPLPNWKGVYNAKSGWTHARNALEAVHKECLKSGVVKFVSGPSGAAKEFIFGENGETLGVRAEDGTEHRAGKVVCAAGGWIDELVDTKGQIHAHCWTLVHIELTEEEVKLWKDAPVVNNRELGYFFEPDAVGRRLKIAPKSPGYTNYITPNHSVPRCKAQNPTDTIPSDARAQVREFLRECMPSLADRPFSHEQMCWDGDSPDSHFVIAEHPEHKGLVIAGGGSGHGFKFLPTIGSYILDLVEGHLASDLAQVWRWRPHQEVKQNYSRPPRPPVDLSVAEGWNHD
ncbi:fructosyl amino acid oxidase [Pseudohyphozyma bogoriensis]|nr:fructosyl amino acid oxidase [Pseudohyphozyma bogoriensis]